MAGKEKWEELQTIFEDLLGSRNVYYQPPDGLMMRYPAIRYKKSKIQGEYANNAMYTRKTRYEIIVIDVEPDNPVIEKLLNLQYCSHDRWYPSDGLNHDVLTLYY